MAKRLKVLSYAHLFWGIATVIFLSLQTCVTFGQGSEDIIIIEAKDEAWGESFSEKRRALAGIIQGLYYAQAKVIVIVSSCPGTIYQNTQEPILKYIHNAGNVYFSFLFAAASIKEKNGFLSAQHLSMPVAGDLAQAASGIGHLNLELGKDKTLSIPAFIFYQNKNYPALSLAVAARLKGIPLDKLALPGLNRGKIFLKLPADYQHLFNAYPAEEILELSHNKPEVFARKICFVGEYPLVAEQAAALYSLLQAPPSAQGTLPFSFPQLVYPALILLFIFLYFIIKSRYSCAKLPKRLGPFSLGFSSRMKQEGAASSFFYLARQRNNPPQIIMADTVSQGKQTQAVWQGIAQVLRQQPKEETPESILQTLNQFLRRQYRGLFVNLACLQLLNQGKQLKVLNAGFEPGLCYNIARDEFRVLGSDEGISLGMAENAVLESWELSLSDADLALFFNSGITRSRNVQSRLFGREGLKEAVRRLKLRSPQDTSRIILKEVLRFSQQEFRDDMFVLVVKFIIR